MPERVGTLAELWRFPVKSMAGERLKQAEMAGGAILGDRAYALVEAVTGKVVTAKSVRSFPDLLDCRAEFLEPPKAGDAAPAVRITLPDGTVASSESGEAERILSAYYDREVTLERAAPPDFTIDMYIPDVEGADAEGRRDVMADQKAGSAFYAEMGTDSPVPEGAFFDLFPLSVITSSTLDRLSALEPASRFDAERFRMNATIATDEDGFVENEWIGRQLSIGDSIELQIAMADPRCVMTTLAQGDLPRDSSVLRTLVEHNRLDLPGGAAYPCAGVYAVATVSGTLFTDDAVAVS